MDLLNGYGSDGSFSTSSSDHEGKNANAKSSTAAVAVPRNKISSFSKTTQKVKRGGRQGKRILSLGAVLPPEIFERLTRPPEEDDSSTSSFGGYGNNRSGGSSSSPAQPKKGRKRSDNNSVNNKHADHAKTGAAGDRTELNSLLSELRSTSTKKMTASSKSGNEGEKLGMAFMSYSSSTTTSKKGSAVVDVHVAQSARPPSVATPSTTKLQGGGTNKQPFKQPAPPAAVARSTPSPSRLSDSAPAAATSFKRSVQQYSHASSVPQYPAVASHLDDHENVTAISSATTDTAEVLNSDINTAAPQSRKQRREEERLLRSGAFQNSSATTTDLQQPCPTEFAPTAHAAAIASKAARRQGIAAGGGGSVGNIAMYDPQSGADVKGLGVTGKHRSKHQINQLMASAISLEAHRASEAELARFGVGGGKGGTSSRADAKRKYGW